MGLLDGIGGALVQGIGNIISTNMANKTAINLANTAHQREVVDMKAAGLNPLLSAGGNGASVPSIQAPEMPDFQGAAISKRQVDMQEKLNENTMNNANLITKSQIDKLNADKALTEIQALQALHDYNIYVGRKQSSKDSGPVQWVVQGLDQLFKRAGDDPRLPIGERVQNWKDRQIKEGFIPEIVYDKHGRPNYTFTAGRYIKNPWYGKDTPPLFKPTVTRIKGSSGTQPIASKENK